MIRVVIVSSMQAIRAGLQAILEAGPAYGREDWDRTSVQVVGQAARLEDLGELLVACEVLVVTEEAVDRESLNRLLPRERHIGLLLLAGTPGAARQLLGLPLRGWGVLPLDASGEELLASVGAVAEGLLVGALAMFEPLFIRPRAPEGEEDEPIEPLTERESQVLQLLAEGLANKQIAVALGISEHTVKFHVSTVFSKLRANSRTEAVRLGVQKGLVSL